MSKLEAFLKSIFHQQEGINPGLWAILTKLKTELEGAAGWSSVNGARSIVGLLELIKGF